MLRPGKKTKRARAHAWAKREKKIWSQTSSNYFFVFKANRSKVLDDISNEKNLVSPIKKKKISQCLDSLYFPAKSPFWEEKDNKVKRWGCKSVDREQDRKHQQIKMNRL